MVDELLNSFSISDKESRMRLCEFTLARTSGVRLMERPHPLNEVVELTSATHSGDPAVLFIKPILFAVVGALGGSTTSSFHMAPGPEHSKNSGSSGARSENGVPLQVRSSGGGGSFVTEAEVDQGSIGERGLDVIAFIFRVVVESTSSLSAAVIALASAE